MTIPTVIARTSLVFTITLDLTEAEARALDCISAYDERMIVNLLVKGIERGDVKEHEEAIRSLLHRVRNDMAPQLTRIDKTRAIWNI